MKASWSLSLLCLLLTACASSPMGRSQLLLLPADQMSQMGLAAFTDLKAKSNISANASTNRYVECVARAVTAVVSQQAPPWEVVVFEDDSANAFALPGGKIGVNTGLLKVAVDQNQLATVIGHEIAHVLAQHGNERMSLELATQTGAQVVGAVLADSHKKPALMAAMGLGIHYGMKLPYSRTHEAEADMMGLELMARAGFNPQASIQLWRNMAAQQKDSPPEFMSTHPAHSSRINGLSARMGAALQLYQSARQQGRQPNCQR